MIASHTTDDGFVLSVHGSLYVDWGLAIHNKDGDQLFYNPCCLSNESWGSKPSDKYDDWEAAEEASLKGDHNAFVPWEESDWVERLKEEADELIEAYLGEDATP